MPNIARVRDEVFETTPLLDVRCNVYTTEGTDCWRQDEDQFADVAGIEDMASIVTADDEFPTAQLCVLAFVRIIEPITFTSVLPYIYSQTHYLLTTPTDPHPTGSIAVYSALLISSFAFSETLTSHLWGKLSDRYGRKPIIITGLIGSAVSLLLYGLSTNIALAMAARIVGGLLNGNVGVLQTAVMELTGSREDWRAKGQLVLPFVWCLGSIIGPAIGGGFAPSGHEDYSEGDEGMMHQIGGRIVAIQRFPYLLPNLVCVVVALSGIIVGWLWMEETNVNVIEASKEGYDNGLAIGKYLLGWPKSLWARLLKRAGTVPPPPPPEDSIKETEVEEETDSASIYESNALTTANPSSSTSLYASLSALDSSSTLVPSTTLAKAASIAPKKSIYTPRFYALMASFFILYYHTTAFEHLLAIFLQSSLPPLSPTWTPHDTPLSPGFGFTTNTMGLLFLIQGVFQMCMQFIAFPFLARRWSNLTIYLMTLSLYPLLYTLMPLLVLLPARSNQFYGCLAALLTVKVLLEITCYPALFLVLYEVAVESDSGMGCVYGLSAAVAGAAKGVGPVLTGLAWRAGMDGAGVGAAWWVLGGVSLLGLVLAICLVVSGEKEGGKLEEE